MNGVRQHAMVVPAAFAASPLWRGTAVAALTGSQTWTSPGPVIGFEADEPADTNPAETPTGLIRFSQTVTTINGALSDDNGANYTLSGQFLHAMTAYRAASGAVVFAAGTVQYAWGLDDVHDRPSAAETPVLKQAITNLLADLGALPPAYPFPSGLVMPTAVDLDDYGFPTAADTTPPAAPTGLAGTPTQTSVALTWSAATDNVAVTGYRVYRDGVQVAAVGAVTSHTVTGLTAGTSYQWRVTALDAAGNESTPSNTVTVATTPQATGLSLTDLKKQLNRPLADTTDDAELQLYLDAAIEAVENIIGGPVQVTTVTETHRANRAGVILPYRQPLIGVTSLSYGGSAVATGDYTVDLGAGMVSLGYWGADPYTLVYQAGYTTLPASFRLAILIIAQHLWRTQHGGSRTRAGDDPVMMPGLSFAIPARAAELLRAGTTPAVV